MDHVSRVVLAQLFFHPVDSKFFPAVRTGELRKCRRQPQQGYVREHPVVCFTLIVFVAFEVKGVSPYEFEKIGSKLFIRIVKPQPFVPEIDRMDRPVRYAVIVP